MCLGFGFLRLGMSIFYFGVFGNGILSLAFCPEILTLYLVRVDHHICS